MNDFNNAIRYNEGINTNSVMTKVFSKMFLGLIVTALAAYFTFATGAFIYIVRNPILEFGIAILEVALVIYLSVRVVKMSKGQANFWFYTYAVLNGITMSYIFAAYTQSTIFLAFLCSAAMFGCTAIFGAITKKDLSTVGTVGVMLLIGITITTLLNMLIFKSTGIDLFLLYAGLVLFAGITAYDIQNIKNLSNQVEGQSENLVNTVATLGALEIYLDFINIFVRLLAIIGNRSDD